MLTPELAILSQRGILNECINRADIMARRFGVIDVDANVGYKANPLHDGVLTAYADYDTYLNAVLPTAVPIVWNMDIWNAAVRDADQVFPDLKLDMLEASRAISEHQLWLFQGVHFRDYDPEEWGFDGREMSLDAVLVGITERGLLLTLFFIPTLDWRSDGVVTHYLRMLTPIRNGAQIDARVSTFVAAIYFLGLKVTTLERYRPHSKKQIRRLEKKGEIPAIRVITLRKATSGEAKTAKSVEWQHQWLVAGHWRRQWFPSSNEHRPIYIQPHLKGPEDKPMMPLRPTLYRAVR